MFVTLVLQCHGLFVTYKLLEMKRNQMLCMHLSAKKNYLMRKRKHAQLRRLRRKHKSLWVVVNGRIDQWWRNMIGGNLSGSFGRKTLGCQRFISWIGCWARSLYSTKSFITKLSFTGHWKITGATSYCLGLSLLKSTLLNSIVLS